MLSVLRAVRMPKFVAAARGVRSGKSEHARPVDNFRAREGTESNIMPGHLYFLIIHKT